MDENAALTVPSKKKVNWLAIGIAAGIVAAIVLGIFWISSLSGAKALSAGDTAQIAFTLTFSDGSVISNSSQLTVGKLAESFGFASDKLDSELGNLNVGEKKTIELSAADVYGDYNSSNVIIQERTTVIANTSSREVNRTFDIPTDAFSQQFNEDAVVGKTYDSDGVVQKVLSISNSSVKMSIDNKVGDKIALDSEDAMYLEIVSLSADKITIKYGANAKTINTTNGNYTISVSGSDILQTWTPSVGQMVQTMFSTSKVISVNETAVVMDGNSEYSGKSATITIEVTKLVKSSTSTSTSTSVVSNIKQVAGAPTVELFVMSYCPFGIQNEKGILPAAKLLEGKINFQVKFVYYAMHGLKELDENTRQYCIQEEQNDKFLDYLECFLQAGDATGCLKTADIDTAKLDNCVSATDDKYSITPGFNDESTWLNGRFPLYNVFKADNDKYQVAGSPTLIINGQQAQSARDPQSLLTAICNAFTDKPAECSQKLSTETPSATFGSTTTTSGGAAQCG